MCGQGGLDSFGLFPSHASRELKGQMFNIPPPLAAPRLQVGFSGVLAFLAVSRTFGARTLLLPAGAQQPPQPHPYCRLRSFRLNKGASSFAGYVSKKPHSIWSLDYLELSLGRLWVCSTEIFESFLLRETVDDSFPWNGSCLLLGTCTTT